MIGYILTMLLWLASIGAAMYWAAVQTGDWFLWALFWLDVLLFISVIGLTIHTYKKGIQNESHTPSRIP